MPDFLQLALERLVQGGAPLPARAATALRRSVGKYGAVMAEDLHRALLEKMFTGLRTIVNPQPEAREDGTTATVGETRGSLRASLLDVIERYGAPDELGAVLNLDFKIETAVNVMRGAGRFVVQNSSDVRVDEYPALELKRVYDRDVPRGQRRLAGGALVPVPDQDWPHRWHAAAEASGDAKALQVLEKTGRMVALKSSGIWAALGAGAGGYTDTLQQPFDPLAFNTGFRQREVNREDAEALGLLEHNEPAKRAMFDWAQLITREAA